MPKSDLYADFIRPWPSGDGVTIQDMKASGDINFQSNKGINCLDPVSDQDIATKKYVDDNGGGLVDHAGTHFFGSGDAVDLAKLQPSGDVSWAGNKITDLATCTESGDGANKKYVDENAGTTSKIQDADADTLWDTEETADKDEIQGKVAGVEFFRGHGDGIITLAKQSKVRVYRATSNQVIPTGLETKIQFNGETYDTQNEFDITTNHRFTAKKGGYYQCNVVVRWEDPTAGGRLFLMLNKNGANNITNYGQNAITGKYSGRMSCIVYLSVNDYIEVGVYQETGGNEDIGTSASSTILTIHKLS